MPTLVLSETLGSFSFCLLNILNWTMMWRLMPKKKNCLPENYSSCLCSWRNSFNISYLLSAFACRIVSSDISSVSTAPHTVGAQYGLPPLLFLLLFFCSIVNVIIVFIRYPVLSLFIWFSFLVCLSVDLIWFSLRAGQITYLFTDLQLIEFSGETSVQVLYPFSGSVTPTPGLLSKIEHRQFQDQNRDEQYSLSQLQVEITGTSFS